MFKVEVKQGHIEQTQMKCPLYQKGVTSTKATVAIANAQISSS